MVSDILRKRWREVAGASAVLATRLLALPRTPWEADEVRFLQAVIELDPAREQPHWPGFPLYVGLGKLLAIVFGDPFASLVALSVIASVVGYFALASAFRRWLGDPTYAALGALIFYLSAAMLVHSPLPNESAVTLMFAALALRARDPLWAGFWWSAAVGADPRMILAAAISLRGWRAVAAFVAMLPFWFLPLLEAGRFPNIEVITASLRDLPRFIAHPWGTKWIAVPVLGLAAFGARKVPRVLLFFAPAALATAFFTADRLDAVRASLPFGMVIACAAGAGLTVLRIRGLAWIATAVFAIASWIYVRPLIEVRKTPSPVVAAARFPLPAGTMILHEVVLQPHAELLMPHPTMPLEPGLAAYATRPEVPLYAYVLGRSPHGQNFGWPSSDPLRKLTRAVYTEVALEPIPPSQRYLPMQGLHALERLPNGDQWRWLGKQAVIRTDGSQVRLTFRLSPESPIESNVVRVGEQTIEVKRGMSASVVVKGGTIHIVSERSFVPGNGDNRELAVQLVGVRVV